MDQVNKKVYARAQKDMGLKGTMYDVEIFHSILRLHEKEEDFKTLMREVNTLTDYDAYRHSLIEKCVEELIESDGYEELNNVNFPKPTSNYPKGDVYKGNNLGKIFLSVDLKDANFSILKAFGFEPLEVYPTYKDWISSKTNRTHLVNSKHFRQVIFGKTNPKRIVRLQKDTMTGFADEFVNTDDLEVVVVNNDEVVFDVTNMNMNKCFGLIPRIKEYFKLIKLECKVEIYTLHRVLKDNKDAGYVKRFIEGDKRFEIKGCNSRLYNIVYRALKNGETEDMDSYFYDGGILCKMVDLKPMLVELLELKRELFGHAK